MHKDPHYAESDVMPPIVSFMLHELASLRVMCKPFNAQESDDLEGLSYASL
jgi:hypothetical protein